VFDVDLDRLAGDGELSAAAGSWPIALERHARDPVPLEDLIDRGDGHIDLVVPLQKETDADRAVLPLVADLEHRATTCGGWQRSVCAGHTSEP